MEISGNPKELVHVIWIMVLSRWNTTPFRLYNSNWLLPLINPIWKDNRSTSTSDIVGGVRYTQYTFNPTTYTVSPSLDTEQFLVWFVYSRICSFPIVVNNPLFISRGYPFQNWVLFLECEQIPVSESFKCLKMLIWNMWRIFLMSRVVIFLNSLRFGDHQWLQARRHVLCFS